MHGPLIEPARKVFNLKDYLIAASISALGSSVSASWQISTKKDEMRDETVVHACIRSTNTIRQAFPYNAGPTFAKLCLYTDGQDRQAYIQISQGQLLCEMPDETLDLRVDQKAAESLECTGTSSLRRDIGYFSNEYAAVPMIFLARKVVRVQASIYSYGSAVFSFNADGRKLPKEFKRLFEHTPYAHGED